MSICSGSGSISAEGGFPGSWMDFFSLCSQHGRRGEGALLGFFYKVLVPFMRLYPYDLITSQSSPPNTIAWGVRLQNMNFLRGHKRLVHSAGFN